MKHANLSILGLLCGLGGCADEPAAPPPAPTVAAGASATPTATAEPTAAAAPAAAACVVGSWHLSGEAALAYFRSAMRAPGLEVTETRGSATLVLEDDGDANVTLDDFGMTYRHAVNAMRFDAIATLHGSGTSRYAVAGETITFEGTSMNATGEVEARVNGRRVDVPMQLEPHLTGNLMTGAATFTCTAERLEMRYTGMEATVTWTR